MHQIKFAVAGPLCAPLAQVFAIFAVVNHARIPVAIGDEEITIRPEVESRRAIERVLRIVIGSGRARAEIHEQPALRRPLHDAVSLQVNRPNISIWAYAQAMWLLSKKFWPCA